MYGSTTHALESCGSESRLSTWFKCIRPHLSFYLICISLCLILSKRVYRRLPVEFCMRNHFLTLLERVKVYSFSFIRLCLFWGFKCVWLWFTRIYVNFYCFGCIGLWGLVVFFVFGFVGAWVVALHTLPSLVAQKVASPPLGFRVEEGGIDAKP